MVKKFTYKLLLLSLLLLSGFSHASSIESNKSNINFSATNQSSILVPFSKGHQQENQKNKEVVAEKEVEEEVESSGKHRQKNNTSGIITVPNLQAGFPLFTTTTHGALHESNTFCISRRYLLFQDFRL
jgi:sortase (surface protein transpeptidase)